MMIIMMMGIEHLMEWELEEETEELRENVSQCYFVQLESHVTWPETEYSSPWWETGD
jgi:hypothetical protein